MSPGYLPFKDALDLPAFFCENCGFWQRHFAKPESCPLCIDARHVLPQKGWRFHDLAEAERRYPCRWAEVEPDVWRFSNDPVDGIGSSGYLISTPHGNLAFEGCAVYSAEALAFIAELGGVQVLAASHPHSYGAIWQLQDRFDPELALHTGDLAWSGALCVSWPFDDVLEVLPGLTLHLTAGHFAGHTVLFDRARRILRRLPQVRARPRRSTPRHHDLGPQGVRARHSADAHRTQALPGRLRAARFRADVDALRAGREQRPAGGAGADRLHARDPAPRLSGAARQAHADRSRTGRPLKVSTVPAWDSLARSASRPPNW